MQIVNSNGKAVRGDDLVQNLPVENSAERVKPRLIGSGPTRGTQTVGYGGAKIDGSNNRITVTVPSTGEVLGFGSIPNSIANEFGFFSLDSDGNVITKIVNGTTYVYRQNGENFLQSGLLPDATGGFIITKEGTDVADVFN